MINLKNSVSGRFKFEKFKAKELDGVLVEVPGTRELAIDWFDNLILDQGLNELGTTNIQLILNYCHVGTGNATPTVLDSGLQSLLATTNTKQSETESFQSENSPYYRSRTIVFRFGEGVAAGNLAEVGVGWLESVDDLFSRTLIKDGLGNPTTLTVDNDEYLDVTYELRIYPSLVDSIGTVVFDGVTYDYTARASNISTASFWATSRAGNGVSAILTRAFSGAIGDVFSTPAGTPDTCSSSSGLTYSNGSNQAGCTSVWGLNDGNFAGGIRSLGLILGWTCWQIEFSSQVDSSAIPKDENKIFSVNAFHSWARAA